MIEHNNFIKELKVVISEVKNALKERQSGIAGEGNVEQLQQFLINLERMEKEASSHNLPPQAERLSSMGWFITDTWPLASPLGEKIIEIEQKYRKLQ
jgi:hypothetical protein